MFLGVSVIESAVSCLGHMVMPDFFVNFVLTMFDIYVSHILSFWILQCTFGGATGNRQAVCYEGYG
jgi:hypothetical protein